MNLSRRILYFLREIGIDPIRIMRAPVNVFRFLKSFCSYLVISRNFRNLVLSPAITDYSSNSGQADGHYFWQDIIVARWIYEASPTSHFDVGSRVDGFIAHLICFRKVIQLDIRPNETIIPNLEVKIGNAQSLGIEFADKYDSVSSLHSIEHFGLGRYGDPISEFGHLEGLQSIAKSVGPGGTLYVSFPVGRPRVEFNSQRVIHPLWPIENLPQFKLVDFVLLPWKGHPITSTKPSEVDIDVVGQAGIYRFKRINS